MIEREWKVGKGHRSTLEFSVGSPTNYTGCQPLTHRSTPDFSVGSLMNYTGYQGSMFVVVQWCTSDLLYEVQ